MRKNVKKNAAGHVEVWMLYAGESSQVSNVLSVKIVVFSSPKTVRSKKYRTGMYGLRSGNWNAKHTRH
jgi:hypothetical protein